MVLGHSSLVSHVSLFQASASITITDDLEDIKPSVTANTSTTMDVDQQHLIDEGYGTQMEVDTEEDHEGGVRLDLTSNGSEPPTLEGESSAHSGMSTDSISPPALMTELHETSLPTLTTGAALPSPEIGPTEPNIPFDADMNDLLPVQWPTGAVDESPFEPFPENEVNVDFAEVPLPSFEETLADVFADAGFAFQLPGGWTPTWATANAVPAAHDAGNFPTDLGFTGLMLNQADIIQLQYMDDWENQLLVPDRDHVSSMTTFFRHWRAMDRIFPAGSKINREAYPLHQTKRPEFIRTHDLKSDKCDIQGIDWTHFGTTREKARQARKRLYCQRPASRYRPPCQICSSGKGRLIRDRSSFFNFKQLSTNHIPHVDHWQLRNLLTTTSQSDIFYASRSKILHTSPLSSTAKCIANLHSTGGHGFNVTTLAAGDDFVLAGSLQGEYALIDLSSSPAEEEEAARSYKGRLSSERNGITNHVHLFPSRSSGGSPTHAIFVSNDCKLRVLDCYTNTVVSTTPSTAVINCAATSPDGRLRVQVGDFNGSQIADAVTGAEVQRLEGNTGDAFACAWANDGVTVAVAGQDSHILVFDARNWSKPIADIATEMDCARSLLFSPVGGGKKTLVAAESSDYVNIIDATRFDSKQVVEMFGAVAGVCFSDDGSELLVGNGDARFGGIFTYRRAGNGGEAENGWFDDGNGRYFGSNDWLSYDQQEWDPRVRVPVRQRYVAEFEDLMF